MLKGWFETLVQVGVVLFLVGRYMYKVRYQRATMRATATAIMNNEFSEAQVMLLKMGKLEINALKAAGSQLPVAKAQQKLERVRLFAMGVDGCLEKTGIAYSMRDIMEVIHVLFHLLAQRRTLEKMRRGKDQGGKRRKLNETYTQNVNRTANLWRELELHLQESRG